MKEKIFKIFKYTFAIILISIGIIALFKSIENNSYNMICASVSCFICGYVLTPLFDKKIKKYTIKKSLFIKTTIIILNIILFLLSGLYPKIINNLFYTLLNIFINTIFLYMILITSEKENNNINNNKTIIIDSIKEGISFALIYITILSSDNLIKYKKELDFIVILLSTYSLFLISPLFGKICKKTNKSFNKIQKSILFFIPITSLQIIINIGLFFVINNSNAELFKYYLYFYIVFIFIFFIFYFKMNKNNTNKDYKSKNLYITISLFIISILFLSKLTLVNLTNLELKDIDTKMKTTLKSFINNSSIKIKTINTINNNQDNYNLDIIKIHSKINDYYIEKKGKDNITLKNNEKIFNIEKENSWSIKNTQYKFNISKFFEDEETVLINYFLQKNKMYNKYDYYMYLIKNKKYKVSIFDRLDTILIFPLVNNYLFNLNNYYVEFIKLNNYDGIITKVKDNYYSIEIFNKENNYSYEILMINYTKNEIYDFIEKIEILPETNSYLIENKIGTDFNKIYFNFTDSNNKYECFDNYENENNNNCKNGIFTNGIFNINANYKTEIYYNDKYYLVYNKGNLYENSTVNIIDNSGNLLKEMNIKESLCNNGSCQYYGLRENNGLLYYIDESNTIKTFDLKNILNNEE